MAFDFINKAKRGWVVYLARNIASSFPDLPKNVQRQIFEEIVNTTDNFVSTGGLENGTITANDIRGHIESADGILGSLEADDISKACRIIAVATSGAALDMGDKTGAITAGTNSVLGINYLNDPRLKDAFGIAVTLGLVAGLQLDTSSTEGMKQVNNYLFCELLDIALQDTAEYYAGSEALMQFLEQLLSMEMDTSWVTRGRFGFLLPKEKIPTLISDLFKQGYTTASPLALDLDGDGIETINLNNSNVMFDLDGDVRKNGTGWLNGDDGFLVFDHDGNGLVDNGSEMFGNSTARYDGTGAARDGFAALAQEDSNGDGVVNNLDVNWQSLQIWRDVNQDGVSQADELFSMMDLGISSIKVDYSATNIKQNDNTLYGTGSYTDNSGATHYMTDVWFAQNTFESEHTDAVEIPEDMKGLANMGGSGAVRDLLDAAAWAEVKDSNSQLREILAIYSGAATRAEQMEMLDDLLYAWANTSGMAKSMEERCAGIFNVKHNNLPGNDVEAWSRKLHILEAFNGGYFFANLPRGGASDPTPFNPTPFNPNGSYHGNLSVSHPRGSTIPTLTVNWGQNQMARLNEAYDLLMETVYNALLLQTRLVPIMDLIDLNIDLETFDVGLDFSRLTQHFTVKLASDPLNGLADLIDFNRLTSDILSGSGWNGYDLLAETIQNFELTQEIKDLLKSFEINMVGIEGYNQNGTAGNDFTIGSTGDDTLNGVNGDDTLYGRAGNDTIYGGAGNDTLNGGSGDDTLEGGNGNDTLEGGNGNDALDGGFGSDTVVFSKGYGHDTVTTYDYYTNSIDKVRLAGLGREDVEFETVSRGTASDFVIKIKETGETLTMLNALSGDNYRWFDELEFGDGTVMKMADILSAGVKGSAGDDTLYIYRGGQLSGGDGNDLVYGRAYADVIYGGAVVREIG